MFVVNVRASKVKKNLPANIESVLGHMSSLCMLNVVLNINRPHSLPCYIVYVLSAFCSVLASLRELVATKFIIKTHHSLSGLA